MSSWCLFPLLSSVTRIKSVVEPPPSGFSGKSGEGNRTSNRLMRGERPFSGGKSLRGKTQNLCGQLAASRERWPERTRLASEERWEAVRECPDSALPSSQMPAPLCPSVCLGKGLGIAPVTSCGPGCHYNHRCPGTPTRIRASSRNTEMTHLWPCLRHL